MAISIVIAFPATTPSTWLLSLFQRWRYHKNLHLDVIVPVGYDAIETIEQAATNLKPTVTLHWLSPPIDQLMSEESVLVLPTGQAQTDWLKSNPSLGNHFWWDGENWQPANITWDQLSPPLKQLFDPAEAV